MENKTLFNGALEVTSNGDVFKIKNGAKRRAAISYSTKYKRYATTSLTINGKQKHFYVHRLVGQAFIPNLLNKPQINHIDGNTNNNNVENLEWCTSKENMKHAVETGLIDYSQKYVTCKYCDNQTITKSGVCSCCRKKLNQARKNLNKLEDLQQSLSSININKLSERDGLIVRMRATGKTHREVGEYFGISKQRVEQIITKAK